MKESASNSRSNSSSKRKASYLDSNKIPFTPPSHPQEDISQGYREQNIASSNLALDYYNNKHATQYGLVEDKSLAGNYFANHLGFWTHCCFYAKDSSIKRFFAEIHITCLSEPAVTCIILEGKTSVGCEYCRCSLIIHPVGGYQAGYPDCSLHTSRSISNDDQEICMDPNLDEEIVEKTIIDTESSTTPIHQAEDQDFGTPDSPPYSTPCSPPYSPSYSPYYPDGECHFGIEETISYANIALNYYNNKNHTKFELVDYEPMGSNGFFGGGLWIHCFFNAKESLIKQFFAEIHYEYPSQVVSCVMLNGETSEGCRRCSTLLHPLGGYEAGSRSHSPPAPCSISDDRKNSS